MTPAEYSIISVNWGNSSFSTHHNRGRHFEYVSFVTFRKSNFAFLRSVTPPHKCARAFAHSNQNYVCTIIISNSYMRMLFPVVQVGVQVEVQVEVQVDTSGCLCRLSLSDCLSCLVAQPDQTIRAVQNWVSSPCTRLSSRSRTRSWEMVFPKTLKVSPSSAIAA